MCLALCQFWYDLARDGLTGRKIRLCTDFDGTELVQSYDREHEKVHSSALVRQQLMHCQFISHGWNHGGIRMGMPFPQVIESFSVAPKMIVQREYVFSGGTSTTMEALFGSATEALASRINDPELALLYLLTE